MVRHSELVPCPVFLRSASCTFALQTAQPIFFSWCERHNQQWRENGRCLLVQFRVGRRWRNLTNQSPKTTSRASVGFARGEEESERSPERSRNRIGNFEKASRFCYVVFCWGFKHEARGKTEDMPKCWAGLDEWKSLSETWRAAC